jgi:hypothetical protein
MEEKSCTTIFEASRQIVPHLMKLMAKAGWYVGHEPIVGIDKYTKFATLTIPIESEGPIKAATKEEQKQFDKLIETIDFSPAELPGLKSFIDKAWNAAVARGEIEQSKREIFSLTVLQRFAPRARLYYAEALSVSHDPDDLRKGIELLTAYIERRTLRPDLLYTRHFVRVVEKVGAHKDERFLDAFVKKGGSAQKLNESIVFQNSKATCRAAQALEYSRQQPGR